jgi:hypothetical protein
VFPAFAGMNRDRDMAKDFSKGILENMRYLLSN